MNVSFRNPGPFAAVGFLAAFALAVIVTVAIKADPSWVYGENMLSDLGISDVDLAKDLFNYGCIIIGILTIVFGIGKALCETGCNRASGCIIAIAAIFMILIGFVQSDFGNGNTHDAASIAAFVFMFCAMALSAVGDWKDGVKLSSALSSILVLIVVGCFAGMDIEKVEIIALACGIVWMLGVSAKMTYDSRKAA